jgi:hypothetical protein
MMKFIILDELKIKMYEVHKNIKSHDKQVWIEKKITKSSYSSILSHFLLYL